MGSGRGVKRQAVRILVECKNCIYAQPDLAAFDKKWTAFMCVNPKSNYEYSLLNVTPHGNKLDAITWSGCEYGVTKQQNESRGREAVSI